MLYVRNLKSDVTDDQLRERFEPYGKVERVKKVKDYGFVHFETRENALKAMEELNGTVRVSNDSLGTLIAAFYPGTTGKNFRGLFIGFPLILCRS